MNGDPYYGPFHVMRNGIKMTGATHSDSDFIIYDTPQESRTNRVMMSTASTIPTISSPQIEYSPSVTSTDVASDTTNMTPDSGGGMISYSSPSPISSPSPSPSPSPSGGSSGGGGGYGGGY